MGNEIRARLKQLVEAMFHPVATRIPPKHAAPAADEPPPAAELWPMTNADSPADTQH